MLLSKLLRALPDLQEVRGNADPDITCVVSDSRQVIPGALFVAYRGIGTDGHQYLKDAIAHGAAALVVEQPSESLIVPTVRVLDGRAAVGWLNAAWYGHPSRDMLLAGITGTDGKTTTANLLYRILIAAGRRAGLISTVNAVIGDRTYDTGLHTTTPDAPDIQRYLAEMREHATEVAILETTSHGLAQHRVTGCAFDVAVLTNISHEHLDYHGSFTAYRDAKAMLFRSLATSHRKTASSQVGASIPKTAVLNRDDPSFSSLASIPVERTITYGLHQPPASQSALHLTAQRIQPTPTVTRFEVLRSDVPEALPLATSLLGNFNIQNILAAAGAALALGAPNDAIREGIADVTGVIGRMQRIDRGQSFVAVVDFAHTPNALERALETARSLVGNGGRVHVVFGCAGLRDRDKRKMMGEVAARLADRTVITAEDPRTECLDAIMAESAAALVAAGQTEGDGFVRIPDRQRAILWAVHAARPGDVVIVCGKGHEQSMCFGEIEYPWRDQEAVAWALDTLTGAASAEPPFHLPTWKAPDG